MTDMYEGILRIFAEAQAICNRLPSMAITRAVVHHRLKDNKYSRAYRQRRDADPAKHAAHLAYKREWYRKQRAVEGAAQ